MLYKSNCYYKNGHNFLLLKIIYRHHKTTFNTHKGNSLNYIPNIICTHKKTDSVINSESYSGT